MACALVFSFPSVLLYYPKKHTNPQDKYSIPMSKSQAFLPSARLKNPSAAQDNRAVSYRRISAPFQGLGAAILSLNFHPYAIHFGVWIFCFLKFFAERV